MDKTYLGGGTKDLDSQQGQKRLREEHGGGEETGSEVQLGVPQLETAVGGGRRWW
jgi:hypothetical protein